MFKVNDTIVYGKMGVFTISAITSLDGENFAKHRLYYVLKPVHGSCVIYAPLDTEVFMRPVIGADEARRLMDLIPTLQAEAYYNDNSQDLTKHYAAAIENHSCADLIRLTMSIYAKKQAIEEKGRVFGQIDRHFMKQAEDLLFEELAVALAIPREQVQDDIAARVEDRSLKLA